MNSGKRKNHKVTIRDIAREVGCSSAVVSFVINKNHPVGADLRVKILAAIERMGYRPYRLAPRQKKKIVFLITAFPFSSDYITILQNALEKYHLLMACAFLPRDLSGMKEYLSAINAEKEVGGVICAHSFIESFDLLRYCSRIPSVIFSRRDSMLSHAKLKYDACGTLAAHHFLQHGFRKAAIFVYDVKPPVTQPICDAFQKAFPDKNSTAVIAMPQAKISVENLSPILEDLLKRGINAWFTVSDEFARAINKWAYQTGHAYPRDFAFIMRDVNESGDALLPPVTSIAFPTQKILELTVDALIAKINNVTPENEELLPYLINRASVGESGGR